MENSCNNPLVSVAVFTYNQEAYIKQTLEGILMQKCDFDFEIIIAEDCGTDNTRKICEQYRDEYPEKIILLERNKNLGLLKNYFETLPLSRGKYIAQCAGDDYWIDPFKLSKQVNIMENDDKIGMVCTQVNKLNQNTGIITGPVPFKEKATVTFEELLVKNNINAVTACFRKSLLNKYIEEINPLSHPWPNEDRSLWIWISKNSIIKFIEEVTAIYRVLQYSASKPKDVYEKIRQTRLGYDNRMYYCNLYQVNESVKKSVEDRFYKIMAIMSIWAKDKNILKECIKYYKTSGQYPLAITTWSKELFINNNKIVNFIDRIENKIIRKK